MTIRNHLETYLDQIGLLADSRRVGEYFVGQSRETSKSDTGPIWQVGFFCRDRAIVLIALHIAEVRGLRIYVPAAIGGRAASWRNIPSGALRISHCVR